MSYLSYLTHDKNNTQYLDDKEAGMYDYILAAIVFHIWIHMNEGLAMDRIEGLAL